MDNYKNYYESSLSAEVKAEIVKFQGGFSDNVAWNDQFFDYVKSGHPCGYIGSDNRSKARDRVVELALRLTGLGDRGVSVWLTSGSGRHLMDDPPRGSGPAFQKHVTDYVSDAFRQVTIWSHPDHSGNLSSTQELHKKIFGE